ncbi:LIM and calponin homology domains-containing protein 1-like [Plakobranchus ocellatus]|uniref:LIM and calponin homology domains-containing protein 1-like n=1 Tax=Plakobranchus ocellatus TaxID=259542 RepID=A0AAV3Z0T7_9GAST|nr:LIM and calponin homology domains-containing protein 1-like [Plakobranchus ocellatus]
MILDPSFGQTQDNINVFLKACKSTFGLTDVHLFNPSDLEDLSQRAIAEYVPHVFLQFYGLGSLPMFLICVKDAG